MYHRSFSAALLVGVFLLMHVTTYATVYCSSPYYWWHSINQTQRNQRIADRACQDLGFRSGKSCKMWVYDVVKSASGGHIMLPQNSSNSALWQWDNTNHVIGYCMALDYVQTGFIIQMQLSNGIPHTLIVIGRGPNSITVIESNWDTTPWNTNDAYVIMLNSWRQ